MAQRLVLNPPSDLIHPLVREHADVERVGDLVRIGERTFADITVAGGARSRRVSRRRAARSRRIGGGRGVGTRPVVITATRRRCSQCGYEPLSSSCEYRS